MVQFENQCDGEGLTQHGDMRTDMAGDRADQLFAFCLQLFRTIFFTTDENDATELVRLIYT